MAVERHTISVTTDAAGAGTALSAAPINGRVLEVRQSGTALAGTATYTLTRVDDGGGNGGTILAYTATANPWQVAPREQVSTVSGGSVIYAAGTAVYEPIPVDGAVKLVVSAAGASKTGSISLYVASD